MAQEKIMELQKRDKDKLRFFTQVTKHEKLQRQAARDLMAGKKVNFPLRPPIPQFNKVSERTRKFEDLKMFDKVLESHHALQDDSKSDNLSAATPTNARRAMSTNPISISVGQLKDEPAISKSSRAIQDPLDKSSDSGSQIPISRDNQSFMSGHANSSYTAAKPKSEERTFKPNQSSGGFGIKSSFAKKVNSKNPKVLRKGSVSFDQKNDFDFNKRFAMNLAGVKEESSPSIPGQSMDKESASEIQPLDSAHPKEQSSQAPLKQKTNESIQTSNDEGSSLKTSTLTGSNPLAALGGLGGVKGNLMSKLKSQISNLAKVKIDEQKQSYQEKMKRKRKIKELKRKQSKFRTTKTKSMYKNESLTISDDDSSIRQERVKTPMEEKIDDEIEERRKKIEQLYQIGNATKIGDKVGEAPPPQTVQDEYGDRYDVSVFLKDKLLPPDIHMRIISQHKQELAKEALQTHLSEKIAKKFSEGKSCWQQMKQNTLNCKRYFFPNQLPYLNRHLIEDYIDRYFLINIPDDLSVHDNHKKIYNLIHDLLIKEYELRDILEDREQNAQKRAMSPTSNGSNPKPLTGNYEQRSMSSGLTYKPGPRARSPVAFSFQPGSSQQILKGGQNIQDDSKGQNAPINQEVFGNFRTQDLRDRRSSAERVNNVLIDMSMEHEGGLEETRGLNNYASKRSITSSQKRAQTSQTKLRQLPRGNSEENGRDQALAKTKINRMNLTHQIFLPSPRTNTTFLRQSMNTEAKFKNQGMQYRKTKKDKSNSPMRPSKFTDEEIDKMAGTEQMAKIRKLKNKRIRDPIQIQQELADKYPLPTMLQDINLDHPLGVSQVSSHGGSNNNLDGSAFDGFGTHERVTTQNESKMASRLDFDNPAKPQFKKRNEATVSAGLNQSQILESVASLKKMSPKKNSPEVSQIGPRSPAASRRSGSPDLEQGFKYGLDSSYFMNDLGPQLQIPEKMVEHAEAINAIMMDICPGVFTSCFISYTVDHVKAYFRKVREDQINMIEEKVKEQQTRAGLLKVKKPNEETFQVSLDSSEVDRVKNLTDERLPTGAKLVTSHDNVTDQSKSDVSLISNMGPQTQAWAQPFRQKQVVREEMKEFSSNEATPRQNKFESFGNTLQNSNNQSPTDQLGESSSRFRNQEHTNEVSREYGINDTSQAMLIVNQLDVRTTPELNQSGEQMNDSLVAATPQQEQDEKPNKYASIHSMVHDNVIRGNNTPIFNRSQDKEQDDALPDNQVINQEAANDYGAGQPARETLSASRYDRNQSHYSELDIEQIEEQLRSGQPREDSQRSRQHIEEGVTFQAKKQEEEFNYEEAQIFISDQNKGAIEQRPKTSQHSSKASLRRNKSYMSPQASNTYNSRSKASFKGVNRMMKSHDSKNQNSRSKDHISSRVFEQEINAILGPEDSSNQIYLYQSGKVIMNPNKGSQSTKQQRGNEITPVMTNKRLRDGQKQSQAIRESNDKSMAQNKKQIPMNRAQKLSQMNDVYGQTMASRYGNFTALEGRKSMPKNQRMPSSSIFDTQFGPIHQRLQNSVQREVSKQNLRKSHEYSNKRINRSNTVERSSRHSSRAALNELLHDRPDVGLFNQNSHQHGSDDKISPQVVITSITQDHRAGAISPEILSASNQAHEIYPKGYEKTAALHKQGKPSFSSHAGESISHQAMGQVSEPQRLTMPISRYANTISPTDEGYSARNISAQNAGLMMSTQQRGKAITIERKRGKAGPRQPNQGVRLKRTLANE